MSDDTPESFKRKKAVSYKNLFYGVENKRDAVIPYRALGQGRAPFP